MRRTSTRFQRPVTVGVLGVGVLGVGVLGVGVLGSVALALLMTVGCGPSVTTELGGPVPCGVDGGPVPATCPLQVPAEGDACSEEVRCSYCNSDAAIDGGPDDVGSDDTGSDDAGSDDAGSDDASAVPLQSFPFTCDGSSWWLG
jgi:hypothetical protein